MQLLGSGLIWLAVNWVALLVVLLAFGFIIFVHELGHFMFAKKVGITVHEFALGFGPKLYSKKSGDTEYCLRAFPFGGFVRMEGEDDPDADPNDPGNFQNKPVLSQILVVSGGCFNNYVAALLVLLAIGFVRGMPDLVQSNVVGSLQENSPALRAGLQPEDRIVSVNGVPVDSFNALVREVRPNADKRISLTVLRKEQTLDIALVPKAEHDPIANKTVGLIGVRPSNKITLTWTRPSAPWDVLRMAGRWLVRITLLPVEIVQRLVRREMTVSEVREGTGGPLLIGQMLFELYHQGIWALLFFWAIICTSVGSFNLLPIPALDGARILFLGIGVLRGRPLDPRKEGMVHALGLMVLLAVMVLFTIHDVGRMLKGVHFF